MKKILVATDLSACAGRAVQRALALAAEHGAGLEVIHIIDESPRGAEVPSTLERQLSSQPASDVAKITINVRRDMDIRDIAVRAAELPADLIVLGLHRRHSPQPFRATTVGCVLRDARRPVLVVKDAIQGPYQRAVVAVESSPHSEAALDAVARLMPGGQVYLVHAAHRPFNGFLGRETQNQILHEENEIVTSQLNRKLAALRSELGALAPRFDVVHCEGEVQRVIREQVDALRPDLLGVGTHGRTGLAHAIFGSNAEDLMARAPVDVLTAVALPLTKE